MAIKYIIVLFVETPHKFITAVINLHGVSTNKTIICFSSCCSFALLCFIGVVIIYLYRVSHFLRSPTMFCGILQHWL